MTSTWISKDSHTAQSHANSTACDTNKKQNNDDNNNNNNNNKKDNSTAMAHEVPDNSNPIGGVLARLVAAETIGIINSMFKPQTRYIGMSLSFFLNIYIYQKAYANFAQVFG